MPTPQYEDVYEPPVMDATFTEKMDDLIESLTPNVPSYISDAFSVERNYSKGDICIYDNKVYEFTSAKSEGAWDSTKVTQTTIGAVCTSLNNSLTQLAKIYSSSWTAGTYTASGAKMSNNLVLPKGKYEVTIKTPVNSQTGSYLYVYNATNSAIIDSSYAPCNTYDMSQFVLDCAVDTTIYICLASNSSNTISYAERGGFYAKSVN